MKFSKRLLQNLLQKKDKNYKTELNHPYIEYDIIYSTNNLYNIDNDKNSLLFLSNYIIKFTLINIKLEDLYKFIDLINSFYINYLKIENDKSIDLYLSGSLFQINELSKNCNDDIFSSSLRKISELISDEDYVFSLSKFMHNPLKVNLPKYINDLRNEIIYPNIEILGYSWIDEKINKKLRYECSFERLGFVWISINIEFNNLFSVISENSFIPNDTNTIIKKISINDYISLLNRFLSSEENDEKYFAETLISIMNSNKSYFKNLLNLLEIEIDDYKDIDEIISEEEIENSIEEDEEVEEMDIKDIFKMYNIKD